MATYQTTNRTSYGRFTIEVTENSYNIANNTSSNTIALKYTSSGQYYCGVSAFTVTDSMGNQLMSYSRSYGVVTNISQGTQTIKSGTVTAYHTSTGAGALTIYIKYCIGNKTYYEETFSFANTTIPRASALSLNTTSLTITSSSTAGITATITPKASGFYHILSYTLATSGTSGTLASKVQLNNTSANNYSLTRATILTKMPSTATDTITFTLKTYSDSACTAQVGDAQTLRATVTLNSTMAPTVTRVTDATISTYKISGVLIADGYDKVTAVFKTTVQGGPSSCTTYFTTTYGTLATTSTTTTGSNVSVVSNALPLSSSASGNYVITAYAVDSRGLRSANVTTTAKTINPYSPPVPTITAYRVNSSSSTTADPAGEYLYYKLTGTKANITGNNFNTSTTYSYIQAGSNAKVAYNTAAWVALAAASNITVTAKLTDTISSSNVVSVTVGPAAFPLDLYDDGAGTVGAAIGGVANSGMFDVYLPMTADNISCNSYGAKYSDMTSTSSRWAKIKINSTTSWMLAFTVRTYSAYNERQFRISGYNYNSTGTWYKPLATQICSSDGVEKTVVFGKDGTNDLWVAVPVDSYIGLTIDDVVNGYTQVSPRGLFTITILTSKPTGTDVIAVFEPANSLRVYTKYSDWPTSSTNFYPIFTDNSGSNKNGFIASNAILMVMNGTDNYAVLRVGEPSLKKGYLRLSDNSGSYYSQIVPTTLTANRTVYLPNGNGTLALTSQLPSTATASSVITRTGGTSGSVCDYSNIKKYGNVYTLYAKFTSSSSTSAGSNIFTGTIASAYIPPYDVEGFAYYGANFCGLRIDTSGNVTLRRGGANGNIADSVLFSLTWVV